MSGEMNDCIVVRDQPNVSQVKNVVARASRKIVGREKSADMRTKITAAAGN
jgi:hypothetical protein